MEIEVIPDCGGKLTKEEQDLCQKICDKIQEASEGLNDQFPSYDEDSEQYIRICDEEPPDVYEPTDSNHHDVYYKKYPGYAKSIWHELYFKLKKDCYKVEAYIEFVDGRLSYCIFCRLA